MVVKLTKEEEVIKLLFKDLLTEYNSRNMSSKIGLSHPGTFKILKKLEKKEIVKSRQVGRAFIYSINTKNPVALKKIEIILTVEAQHYKRWIEEFRQLESKTEFVVLFGSILKNELNARDIDLIVVSDKKNYNTIKKIIEERNRISHKPIHFIFQTIANFKYDLQRKYKVTMDIIKTGVVLFGQDKFRKTLIE